MTANSDRTVHRTTLVHSKIGGFIRAEAIGWVHGDGMLLGLPYPNPSCFSLGLESAPAQPS